METVSVSQSFFGGGLEEGHCSKYQKEKQLKGRESWLWLIVSEPLVCGWQTALLGSVVRQNSPVEGHNRDELPTSERPAKAEVSNWARDKIFLRGIILIDRFFPPAGPLPPKFLLFPLTPSSTDLLKHHDTDEARAPMIQELLSSTTSWGLSLQHILLLAWQALLINFFFSCDVVESKTTGVLDKCSTIELCLQLPTG